jgi:Family of unknown function (DUF6502)
MTRPESKSKPPAMRNMISDPNSGHAAAALSSMSAALLDAIARVLTPLVKLLIARGVTYQAASEMLKRVYVRAGQKHFTGESATDTQLSLVTGLNRKEIRRLTEESLQSAAPESVTSFAASVHAAWLTQRRFCERSTGVIKPRVLPRRAQGSHPSFVELVRTVTTDHRPSALLEELLRLQLVDVDEEGNVALRPRPFLSRRSLEDRLLPLAENLGDHASAAVGNVLADKPPYLERSVFSDELSEVSAARLHELTKNRWAQIHDELIEKATRYEAGDSKAGHTANSRIRIGMYFYSEQQETKQDRDDHG